MPVGRMVLLFWILYCVFFIGALVVGGALASSSSPFLVVLLLLVIAACVGSFVYAMYLNLRVQRSGDPRLLRRGIRGTALVLAAKETNTVIQEGDFAWQAPFVWKYHLRVSLPDREPYETDTSICVEGLDVGSTVNVAVAPHNRRRVTIDVGQLESKQRRHAARDKAASNEDALRQLAERRERGELSHAEFEQKKNELLST